MSAERNAAVPAAGTAASRRRRERDALDPAGEDAGVPDVRTIEERFVPPPMQREVVS